MPPGCGPRCHAVTNAVVDSYKLSLVKANAANVHIFATVTGQVLSFGLSRGRLGDAPPQPSPPI